MVIRQKLFCSPGSWKRILNLPCQLSEIGYLPDQFHWNNHRTLRGLFFCITLNSDGTGKGLINGKLPKSRLVPPMLTIYPPGTVLHTIRAVKHDEIYFCYVGKHAETMGKMGFQNCHFEFTQEISDIILRIKKELLLPDSPVKGDNLDLLSLQLLVAIQASREIQPGKCREDGSRFQELVSFMELHYQENIPLEKIISRFGFSRRTFFRQWKKNFTCTYTQYLNELRLSQGEFLLNSTTLSVAEIAQNCAFSSATYFIRKFREKYGLTPESYRKMKDKNKSSISHKCW